MKTTKKKSQIEIKVLAVNTLHKYSKKILQYEIEKLKALQGLDIWKVDGSLKQKYMYEALPEMKGKLPDGTWYSVTYWHNMSAGEYGIKVKVCVNGGSHEDRTAFCMYDEQSFYPFKIQDGKLLLKEDFSYTWLDVVYNVADLQKKAAKIKALAELYEKERDKIYYDFHSALGIERLTRA